MLWFLLSILLFFGLLLWLPLEVEIDTNHALYRARWRGIFGIRGVPEEQGWRWFFKILGWEKEWKAGTKKPVAPKRTPHKPPAKKTKRPFSPRQMWALAKNLFSAVKVKRFRLDWDSGDYIRNAQLYPLFHSLSKRGRSWNINFMGREELEILLQTRLWYLAAAFLRVFFKPKLFQS